MYPNLEAEQARRGLKNAQVAEFLEISRASYEHKKRTERFWASECSKLCNFFNCDFNYLFATESTQQAS